jgi:hypothetical protein
MDTNEQKYYEEAIELMAEIEKDCGPAWLNLAPETIEKGCEITTISKKNPQGIIGIVTGRQGNTLAVAPKHNFKSRVPVSVMDIVCITKTASDVKNIMQRIQGGK